MRLSIKRMTQALSTIVILCAATSAISGSYETFTHLNMIAADYIQKNIVINPDEQMSVKLGDAATDLRLPRCQSEISINLPAESNGQKINTLEMTCSSQPSWHVYVPVDMKILTKVIVAKENIPTKTPITEEMLDFAFRDKNTLYAGYFKDTKDVVNQEPVTTMVAGTVINKHNIKQPVIINRNQIVSIISRHGHIMVSAEGIAKSDGALNETIKVINSSSKRTIDAVVTSSSTVDVGV